MWPLVVSTIVLWYAIGFRYYTLKRGSRRSVRVILDRIKRKPPKEPSGIIDSAAILALQLAEKTKGDLREVIQDHFTQYRQQLTRYAGLVKVIVLIAPLAGLLGTVNGMMEMFGSLASQTFYSQSGGIARGISEALFTTQMGLAVAVPGMIVGRILEKRQDQIERELVQITDIVCSEFPGKSSCDTSKKGRKTKI